MYTVQRSFSLSGTAESPARPLAAHSRSHDSKEEHKQSKKNGSKESLRRCKSTPDKKRATQSQETNPDARKCVWLKERCFVGDLRAKQETTTKQPQLSYFAYLGKNYQGKGRYKALSGNTEVVINLGNQIVAQNRSLTRPASEENAIYVSNLPNHGTAQLVECCSCMCCVKALFYHCTKDGEFERNWADEPCACEAPGAECVARWGILGMLSLFMPCLMCYPVMKVCCKLDKNRVPE